MDRQSTVNTSKKSISQSPDSFHKYPASESSLRNLLKPEITADILGVDVKTLAVWRCTKRYPLPWVRVGRNVMYKPEDVQAFIESRTVSPVVNGQRFWPTEEG
ncbi:helix-turn-helix domain-containing protein [uncultured Desulfobulbus sp.]|uniref:helix-turn-helix domain-containing protein n=1 Tax=uncultured Desulfobulbus sp. TaxID=239745 RepID=UPI0029C856CA|nr:helix-turn-helix domain-containing protein [uncultured Desulfobulbus sp.]